MRQLTVISLVGWLLTGPLVRPAAAVSIEDLFNLKANGLSDDVLVALIETDGSVFRLSADDIITLRRRGLSERVILAMIASGRVQPAPVVAPETEAPKGIGAEPVADVPQIEEVPVVPAIPETVVEAPALESTVIVAVPVFVPVLVHKSRPERLPPPVYWGFGGQRRPDTWEPTRIERVYAGSESHQPVRTESHQPARSEPQQPARSESREPAGGWRAPPKPR
jgi:hypothetical protein